MLRRPTFIVFEGLDGAGKTTCSALLAEAGCSPLGGGRTVRARAGRRREPTDVLDRILVELAALSESGAPRLTKP